MAMQYSVSFLDFTVNSQDSQNASYPVSRITDRNHPLRAWRPTSMASDQRVLVDLGSSKSIVGVGIPNINVAQVKIAIGSVASISDAGYDSSETLYTATQCPVTLRGRVWAPKTGTGRYVRFKLPQSQTPFLGESYYALGPVYILSAITELPRAPGAEYEHWMLRDYDENPFGAVATSPRRIALGFDVNISAAELAIWTTFQGLVTRDTLFLVYMNGAGGDSGVYVMELTEDLRLRHVGDTAGFGHFEAREVISRG